MSKFGIGYSYPLDFFKADIDCTDSEDDLVQKVSYPFTSLAREPNLCELHRRSTSRMGESEGVGFFIRLRGDIECQ